MGRRRMSRGWSVWPARGVPTDVVRAELADERARAATWYHDLELDPARRDTLVQEALERQRARASG